MARLAGVELGGTKSIAVLADDDRIVAREILPTLEPGSTLPTINAILRGWWDEAPFAALGMASFGPLQLDPGREGFGTMLATPKRGWDGARIAEVLSAGLDCPWSIDTDVNAAALAEFRWGAGAGCGAICYITIGTGVGGGLLLDGKPVHGAMHPEIGHLRLRRAAGDDFPGVCPFHGDCIEGLVSGPAIAARFGMAAPDVPDDHPLWTNVAHDLGELACAVILTHSANRILFGGTVSLARQFLLSQIRDHVVSRLGDYLPALDDAGARDRIRIASLGADAGPMGAVALAQSSLQQR
ncbi:fructokinase [Altererythrobacter atlanticus]|uniref:fructokinase n=1 Tax=Croceibacterium atlanticum TaxID=1267766 RepID=A0A0F7KPC6_9SPHN|nr:ROK family protein [Croceibacterium atlanticum]AKH41409.1 Putative fructokinase [Croceibacterium atlanticum]MBB5732871.1 fructokinase [Croceibacterium atlanticum]